MRTRFLCHGVAACCLLGASLAEAGDRTGFRVRADDSAALNSDAGWAGALNEDVAIVADRPFRLRFEIEA